MLARTFLSAKQLDITEKQHAALIDILGRLERGELVHCSVKVEYEDFDFVEDKLFFNMLEWMTCGTVGCIGGWAEALHDITFDVRSNRKLNELFFMPRHTSIQMANVTVEQAAHALSNYLTTGRASWNEVLA